MSALVRERYWTDLEYRLRVRQIADRRTRIEGTEVIPLDVVWLEQDGKCYLCGRQMNPISVRLGGRPDPLLVTIEHRTPLSRGGTHDRENVSLAHRACNLQKGTRTVAEYEAMQAA